MKNPSGVFRRSCDDGCEELVALFEDYGDALEYVRLTWHGEKHPAGNDLTGSVRVIPVHSHHPKPGPIR